MDCKQLNSGVWECVGDGPRDPITNKRNQIRRRGKTKGIAKKKVEEEIEKQGTHGVDSKKNKHITFEKVAWEWFKVYSLGNVKDSTLRSRRSSIKILLRYLPNANIAKVNERIMQNIFIDLFDKDNSRSLMEGVKITANFIFKYAIRIKLVVHNPVNGVVLPVKTLTVEEIENTTIEEEYFNREELNEFFRVVDLHGKQLDREWFYLLAFSGMRVGEMCALKWTDINFDTGVIRVTKTIDMPNHNMRKYKLTPPKTKKSIREFEVDEEIVAMLKRLKTIQGKIRLSERSKYDDYNDENFVFCRANGYPYSSRFIYERMKSLLNRSTITKSAGPHIFRHTHVTMLTEAEVDLKTIMDRVGHEDSKTTLGVYTHVTEKMKKDAGVGMKIKYGDLLKLAKPNVM